MSQRPTLSDSMQSAIRRTAAAISDGRHDAGALADFIEETKSLPLSKFSGYESAIRAAAYVQEPPRQRFLWQQPPKEYSFPVPWFDLFSGNGFRRERVLRAVKVEAPSPFLLAMLIRRLNDWVPQVREAAQDTVRHALTTSAADIVAEVAWATLPVRTSWNRIDADGAAILDSLTERSDVAEAIFRRLLSVPAGRASAVLREVSRRANLDAFLPELAASAVQPAVRAAAYRMLLNRRAVWPDGWTWRWVDKSMGERIRERVWASRELTVAVDFVPTLTAAMQDSSPAVRRIAGDVLIAHRAQLGDVAITLARYLETDHYPSIAERGRFLLSKGR
ncbi:MAG: hypothetical protein C0456_04530 [Hyphomonas sp.]|nr:hypothetical protein [Hyphomonas sp.]